MEYSYYKFHPYRDYLDSPYREEKSINIRRDPRGTSDRRQPTPTQAQAAPQVKVQIATPHDDMERVRELLVDKLGSENGLLRSALAEFIGTFFLLFIGISANIQFKVTDSPPTSLQLAWGFGFAFAVYLAANVSGAHVNPAISIAALVNGGIGFLRFLIYLVAQIIGAFVGSAAAYLGHIDDMNYLQQRENTLVSNNSTAALFATFPSDHMTVYGSLLDQIMGTAILALCIELIVDKRHRIHGGLIPLLAGFVMAMISMTYGSNGGFAINPARDLGPRLFLLCIGYGWSLFTIYDYYFWIPIVGPIIGALIGSWVYKLFIGIHGLNEEIPISKQQKSDSTKSLIEPQTLSWRQTTIPPFPATYSKPTETEPARTPSFFRDIRRDFDHRNAEEKVIDLTTEDSFKRTRAPSPPPSHEPPPPPVSSPATEPEGLRRLFETDRPVPFYRSVFEKKADGPLPTILEVQRKAPEPVISTTTPARPWERDAERYSSAAPSEASVPSQRAPAPPQAPPRLHQQPESSSSYQRTDRDHIQVSLAYYRND